MTEFNTIYDSNRRQVGKFRHGVAWAMEPRERLGEYDYGDEGVVCDNAGKQIARFKDCSVASIDLTTIGHFVEVPFSEFNGEDSVQSKGSTIKRLEAGCKIVGWCIGNSGSACAAIVFIFSREEHVPTTS